MESKVKILFYDSHDEVPTLEEWKKMGRPRMYVQKYKNNNITIWSEQHYSGIRLQVGNKMKEEKDIVRIGDYVVFSDYYDGVVETYKPYKLYKLEE